MPRRSGSSPGGGGTGSELGPNHPDLANTLNNLGVICEMTDKPADAEASYRRAHAIAKTRLPANIRSSRPAARTSRSSVPRATSPSTDQRSAYRRHGSQLRPHRQAPCLAGGRRTHRTAVCVTCGTGEPDRATRCTACGSGTGSRHRCAKGGSREPDRPPAAPRTAGGRGSSAHRARTRTRCGSRHPFPTSCER